MTPFDRLDGFDKARTDEAEEVKRKTALLQSEIEIKDDRCERCTETDGENAFESDWRGDFETRETDEKWDAVAKKKLALKRKHGRACDGTEQKERFFGKKTRRASFQAYSSDEEEKEEEDDEEEEEEEDIEPEEDDVEFEGGLSVDGSQLAKLCRKKNSCQMALGVTLSKSRWDYRR